MANPTPSRGSPATGSGGETRRFAYPEKERALESYKARKRWQLSHAKLATERAIAALDEIKELSEIEDLRVCAGGEYIKNLGWEAA